MSMAMDSSTFMFVTPAKAILKKEETNFSSITATLLLPRRPPNLGWMIPVIQRTLPSLILTATATWTCIYLTTMWSLSVNLNTLKQKKQGILMPVINYSGMITGISSISAAQQG